MTTDYKGLHEAFVSNHSGTTLTEISAAVSVAPLSVLLFACLPCRLGKGAAWCYQFLILALPLLASFTCCSNHVIGLNLVMVACGLFWAFLQQEPAASKKHTELDRPGEKRFITWFRAYVNIATAIAILAVDFTVFPRRFAKAETYGAGLMDTGVGMYVVSMGLVSREAKRAIDRRLQRLFQTVVGILPLLALGIGRLITTKSIDYQEHVSEYGQHWNFFFTLAVIAVLGSLLSPFWHGSSVLGYWAPLLSAIVIGVGYQLGLVSGLSHYIEFGPDGHGGRPDFISANREGLCSCLGYAALYCTAVQMGRLVFWSRYAARDKGLLVALTTLTAGCFCLTHLLVEYVQPISRQMANLPYVVWQIAYSSQLLLSFLAVALIASNAPLPNTSGKTHPSSSTSPPLLQAVSSHQLAFFLLANLATGLVNLSMKTVFASPCVAMITLTVYLALLFLIITLWHHYFGKWKNHQT